MIALWEEVIFLLVFIAHSMVNVFIGVGYSSAIALKYHNNYDYYGRILQQSATTAAKYK